MTVLEAWKNKKKSNIYKKDNKKYKHSFKYLWQDIRVRLLDFAAMCYIAFQTWLV